MGHLHVGGKPAADGPATHGVARANYSNSLTLTCLNIGWSTSDEVDHFIIQMSTDGGVTYNTLSSNVTQNNYSTPGVLGYCTHFRVAGVNIKVGAWAYSVLMTVGTTLPGPVDGTYLNLRLLQPWSGLEIKIAWDKDTRSSSYNLSIYTDPGNVFVKTISLGDVTEFIYTASEAFDDGHLSRGYKFWLIPVNPTGNGSAGELIVSNSQESLLNNVQSAVGIRSISIWWDLPSSSDWAGIKVWMRSEERRVGKEGRARWSPDHEKKQEHSRVTVVPT